MYNYLHISLYNRVFKIIIKTIANVLAHLEWKPLNSFSMRQVKVVEFLFYLSHTLILLYSNLFDHKCKAQTLKPIWARIQALKPNNTNPNLEPITGHYTSPKQNTKYTLKKRKILLILTIRTILEIIFWTMISISFEALILSFP